MGDPETEVVLPLITSDIVDMFEAIAFGKLDKYELRTSPLTAVTVVCTSEGYPGDYPKGVPVTLPGEDEEVESIIFHAGTTAQNGTTVTSGGRVFAITSLAKSIAAARNKSYRTAKLIAYAGKYLRSDIGKDLM